ncbi:peptidoglycan-binding protein, partial [Shigella flexneri]|nr:peptidoglycan-binding protein [Shigella flexneri]EGU7457349.1 peptidoglycan-binding protein [Shigella flexneri]
MNAHWSSKKSNFFRKNIKLLTKYLFFESQGIPDKVDIVSRLKTYGYSISGVETDDGYKALVR